MKSEVDKSTEKIYNYDQIQAYYKYKNFGITSDLTVQFDCDDCRYYRSVGGYCIHYDTEIRCGTGICTNFDIITNAKYELF